MKTSLLNLKYACEETLQLKDDFLLDGEPTVIVSLDHEDIKSRKLFGAEGKVIQSIPGRGVDAVVFKAKELLQGINKILSEKERKNHGLNAELSRIH